MSLSVSGPYWNLSSEDGWWDSADFSIDSETPNFQLSIEHSPYYYYTHKRHTCIMYADIVNCEIFVVKILLDRMGNAKIKCMKIINTNAVRGCWSKNYLTWNLSHENIFDTKYSWFKIHSHTHCTHRHTHMHALTSFLPPCLLSLPSGQERVCQSS